MVVSRRDAHQRNVAAQDATVHLVPQVLSFRASFRQSPLRQPWTPSITFQVLDASDDLGGELEGADTAKPMRGLRCGEGAPGRVCFAV